MGTDLKKSGKSLWIKVINLVLPPRCVVSGEIVGEQGTLALKVWQDLRFLTPPYCVLCGFPFEFEAGPDSRCGPCLAEAPPFAAARSALVGMMMRAGGELIEGVGVIVPVPLHRWRLLRRRYNQAALLGIGMSRQTGLKCLADGLLRTRATPSQGHMKAKDRSENVRKAFTVNPRHVEAIAGRVVLLVDDVFTTGATVKECTKALLQAGAAEVRVLAVARVVRAEQV